MANESSVTT